MASVSTMPASSLALAKRFTDLMPGDFHLRVLFFILDTDKYKEMEKIVPLEDLIRAVNILDSCFLEPQLDCAYNYFELVIQKYDRLLSLQSKEALRREFQKHYYSRKRDLKLD